VSWVLVVLTVGLATTALLLVVLLGLFRNLQKLSRSLKTFQDEVQPRLQEIRDGSLKAQGRLDGLQQQRLSKIRGARIRN
jgi:predicted PurR-regulated permease PerM